MRTCSVSKPWNEYRCRTPRNLKAHCTWLGSTERARNKLSNDATCAAESMVEGRAEIGKNRSSKYTTSEGKAVQLHVCSELCVFGTAETPGIQAAITLVLHEYWSFLGYRTCVQTWAPRSTPCTSGLPARYSIFMYSIGSL